MNFAESLALKAVSLLLALILWVTFLSLKPEERTYKPELEPKFSPNMALVSDLPTATFTYQGSRIALKDFEAKASEKKSFDLNPRETVVEYQTKDLAPQLPKGIKLISAVPETLVYRLEERAEKSVPIKPKLTGEPAEGFEIGTIKLEPAKTIVSGPKSYIAALDFVETKGCDISGLRSDNEAKPKLDAKGKPEALRPDRECSVKFEDEKGLIIQGDSVMVFVTAKPIRSK